MERAIGILIVHLSLMCFVAIAPFVSSSPTYSTLQTFLPMICGYEGFNNSLAQVAQFESLSSTQSNFVYDGHDHSFAILLSLLEQCVVSIVFPREMSQFPPRQTKPN